MRLTEGELESIRARAELVGVSMSRLLVDSALSDVARLSDRQGLLTQLNRFERLLGNLANNVNQLAHQANLAGQVTDSERLAGNLAGVEAMRVQLDELVRELR